MRFISKQDLCAVSRTHTPAESLTYREQTRRAFWLSRQDVAVIILEDRARWATSSSAPATKATPSAARHRPAGRAPPTLAIKLLFPCAITASQSKPR